MLNPKKLKNGYMQYETFSRNGKEYVQYDYRHTDGELFSCTAKTLYEATEKQEKWLNQKNDMSNNMVF